MAESPLDLVHAISALYRKEQERAEQLQKRVAELEEFLERCRERYQDNLAESQHFFELMGDGGGGEG